MERRTDTAAGDNGGIADFFISYTGSDRTWAEWIVWELEDAGYRVVIQAWDFRPGYDFVAAMREITARADRTLAVLSPVYLHSDFALSEWAAALRAHVSGPQPGSERPTPLPPCGSPLRPGMPLYTTDRYPRNSRRLLIDTALDDVRRGTNLNLVGERCMGRTSLLNHLYAKLIVHPGIVITRVNMQDGIDGARAWGSLPWGLSQWPWNVDTITPARRIELDERPLAGYGEVRKVLRGLRSQTTVVVLVDEFERCFDSPKAFPLPRFCHDLRSLLGGDARGPYARAVVATRRSLAEYFTTRQVTSVLPTYLPPRQLQPLSADDADDVLSQQCPHRPAPRPARPGSDLGGRSPVSPPVRGRGVVTRRRVGSRLPLRRSEYRRRLSGQLCIGDTYPMR